MGGGRLGGRRKIALVVPAFEDTGGVITVAEFILRAIRRRDDLDVRVISLATSSRDPCSLLASRPSTWPRGVTTRSGLAHGEIFTHVGAHLGEFEFRRLASRAALAAQLTDSDLIQVVAGTPAWACPVIGLGKPIALQVATLTAVERRMRAQQDQGMIRHWRSAMTRISDRLDHRALAKVDVVMVENPWMLEYARQATDPRRTAVHYAPPGVDTAVFKPRRSKISGPGYVLAVGRLSDKRKNPLLLLEAYALMRGSLSLAPQLVLAGADGPGDDFWARAAELGVAGDISFRQMPTNHELASLYREAICLVLSSDEEGFGMVIIEAMASGIPVIATRCGGPEGIIADGVDGYLVDRDDRSQMASRLAEIVSLPALKLAMGRAARATVERRYSDDVAGDAYLAAYDRLLAGIDRRSSPSANRTAGRRATARQATIETKP